MVQADPATGRRDREDGGPLAPARILLVDDDPRNLLALSEVLEDVAEVVCAHSGREALRHLLKDQFAVVLLDVLMPEMDGYEVASLVRQRPQTARVPIIFISAVNKEDEHLRRGYGMGAVDYVFKPVDPLVLKSKVSVFVDLYEMRREIEAKTRQEQALREEKLNVELERLRTRNELQVARARHMALLSVLPLALYEAHLAPDGSLHRRFVAGDLAQIAGVDAGLLEAGEMRWEDGILPEDLATLPRLTPDQREPFTTEYRWRGSDGQVRHFIDQCVPTNAQGAGAAWGGTLIDITERKELEAQLLQSGKMDAIGQLTGGVAHDFNNLLAVVLGGVQLMERKGPTDERTRTILGQMRHAAEKGADLVRHMMAFARKQELRPSAVSAERLASSVKGLVQSTLGGKVTLAWKPMDVEDCIFADEAQLELAIVNLIINARDAMGDKGGEITVEVLPPEACGQPHPSGRFLGIRVSDQGCGIPPELIARITEPFFTTKPVGRGTGLGLSMVAGFVQQSGGHMRVSSEVGVGTAIEILLPATASVATLHEPQGGAHELDLSGTRVLLVDDEPGVRAVVRQLLEEAGAEVTDCPDGQECLARLEGKGADFEVLLTDLAMPQLNGLQLASRAKDLAPGMQCIIMTGYADTELRVSDHGFPVVQKPLSLASIGAALGDARMQVA